MVTIDRPHDAAIVTFPGSPTALAANITTEAQIHLGLHARVKDVSFVLNELSDPSTAIKLIPGLACGVINLSRTGIFGHSMEELLLLQRCSTIPGSSEGSI